MSKKGRLMKVKRKKKEYNLKKWMNLVKAQKISMKINSLKMHLKKYKILKVTLKSMEKR